MQEWVDGYILAQSSPKNRHDSELSPAVSQFFELNDENPSLCFDAVLNILHRAPPKEVLEILSAGPLEDLIEDHGELLIGRIELEAKSNEKFRELLHGVWESGSPQIWNRILRARGITADNVA